MAMTMEPRSAQPRGAIKLECPGCGQKLRTGAHNLGGFVRCSKCRAKFPVSDRETSDEVKSESPPEAVAALSPASRRNAVRELRALESACQARLQKIGAEAQAAGRMPAELAASLGELHDTIQSQIDCFNALQESHAQRGVLESVLKRLAHLDQQHDRMLAELGSQVVASREAPADQARTIAHLEDQIKALRSYLGQHPVWSEPVRLAVMAGVLALLACGWLGQRFLGG